MAVLVSHELGHVVVYALYIFVFRRVLKVRISLRLIIVGLATVILMDADHLIDYFIYYGFKLDVHLMLIGNYFDGIGKTHVPLHSWELIMLLIISGVGLHYKKRYKFSRLMMIFALSINAHLNWDIIYYGFNPLAYSIIYRGLQGFSNTVFN